MFLTQPCQRPQCLSPMGVAKSFLGESLRDGNAFLRSNFTVYKENVCLSFLSPDSHGLKTSATDTDPTKIRKPCLFVQLSIMTLLPFFNVYVIVTHFLGLYTIALSPCPTVHSKHAELLGLLWLHPTSPNHLVLDFQNCVSVCCFLDCHSLIPWLLQAVQGLSNCYLEKVLCMNQYDI